MKGMGMYGGSQFAGCIVRKRGKWRREKEGGERKELNQTVHLSAEISSIWLGASSCRANSGLAR